MKLIDTQWNGLPGPSHHFGGLASGNNASIKSEGKISYPQKAALQSLHKMHDLLKMEIPQYWIPPQLRPNPLLLQKAKSALEISQAYSSSFMWVANAATIIPSTDTYLNKVQILPANLTHFAHRSQETPFVHDFFSKLPSSHFQTQAASLCSGDEGAANHMRLCKNGKALHVFVYNSQNIGRQSLASQQDIAKRCQIKHTCFVEQNPTAIKAGVFHNDVIALSHKDKLILHETAFVQNHLAKIQNAWKEIHSTPLQIYKVTDKELSLEQAVQTYFFNAQFVSSQQGDFLLLPQECNTPLVTNLLHSLQQQNFMDDFRFYPLQESMGNGGGPACLRLRIPLTEQEIKKIPKQFQVNKKSLSFLEDWIVRFYPEELQFSDLQKHNTVFEASHLALQKWIFHFV